MAAIKQTKAELHSENEKLKKQIAKLKSRKIDPAETDAEKRIYQKAIENSPISIVITDTEGKIEFVNPFFSKLTGYSYKEVIGKTPNILSSGYHPQKFYKDLWETIKNGKIWKGEFLNTKKNGKQYWESATISPVFNNRGEITHFVSTKEDITERKKSEENFQQLAEQSPNMIFINQRGRIVYANKKCEEVLGYTRKELYSLDFDFRKLIEPEYANLIKGEFEKYLQGEETHTIEYAIRTKIGRRIDVLHSTKIIEYDGSSALLGIITEITHLKEIEEKVRQSEQDYRRLFDEAHDLIIVFEPENEIILDVNQRACEVYGYKRSELIGMSLKKISKFVSRGEENIKKTLQKGTYKHFETIHISKEGREIHLEINASVLEYMGQNAILSLNRDITERKKADEAIRESERKLSTIIDNIPGMTYRCLMDEFWTMKFISKGCEEITGYSQLELLDNKELSYEDLIYPEDREIVRQEVFKTLDTQNQFELEYRIVRKDGSIRWVWERGVQIEETMDGIPLLEGIIEDITKRKIAEDALQEAYDIINKSPAIPFLWKNEEGWPVEYVSENVVNLFEYTAEEFMSGKISYSKIIHPEDLKRVGNEVSRYSSEEGTDRFSHETYRIVTKSGNIKWVEDKTYIRRDENNSITHYQGIVEDITVRRLTELARLESEEKFSKTFSLSPSPMIISEIESGKVVDINKSFEKIIKYSKQEILGKSVFDLNLWTNIEDRGNYIKKMKVDKSVSNLEIKIRTKSGEIKNILISGEILTIQDKPYLLTSGIDITERKRIEEALIESKQMLSHVLNTIPVRVFWKDLDGVYLGCDQLFARDAGRSNPEEVIGDNDYNMGWAEQAELYRSDDRLVIESGKPKINYEEPQTTPEGKTIWLRTSKIPLLDSTGNIYGVLGTYEDITERKLAEQALRESENKFRNVLENIQLIGLMLDKNGRLTFANDFLLELTGWKREEAIGQNWFDNFLPDDVREKVKKMFFETLETGVFPLSYQNEIITKGGELRLIDWSNIIHQNNQNKTYAVTSIGEDITERKKAEKKLLDSHNQLRSLAERLQMIREEERATIAREIHDDLGQVLTALKMDISSLQRKLNVEPGELTDRTDKMLELVNSSIQTVKRIATELRPGILDDLGLFSAIEWLVEEFQNRTKIDCQLDIEGEMDLIDDEISIAVFRIFQETITNITRHSNATQTIIKLFCSDKYLMLDVQDNGKGISAEELYGPGSLGILGMRERVHILRGEFEISGEAGKGTKVQVKIPLRKKA